MDEVRITFLFTAIEPSKLFIINLDVRFFLQESLEKSFNQKKLFHIDLLFGRVTSILFTAIVPSKLFIIDLDVR